MTTRSCGLAVAEVAVAEGSASMEFRDQQGAMGPRVEGPRVEGPLALVRCRAVQNERHAAQASAAASSQSFSRFGQRNQAPSCACAPR